MDFLNFNLCLTKNSTMNLNCTDASRLKKLLVQMLQELERINGTSTPASDDDSDEAYLYILLIMIFYGFLAGGLIYAYTRSRKQESKDDPYHLYIEREWGRNAKNVLPTDESHHRESVESEHLL